MKCKVNDCYHRAFFYVMGIAGETRRNINSMFDFKTDCMREIGGNEHQLFGFFKCVMDHGVMVRTLEYSLPARLQQYELGEKIENYAAKHNRPMPWVV